jgi:serralysin
VDANSVAAGDQAFQFIGFSQFSGVAGQLRAITNNAGNTIVADTDGNGSGDIQIQLTGSLALTAGDFIL